MKIILNERENNESRRRSLKRYLKLLLRNNRKKFKLCIKLNQIFGRPL